MNAISRRAFAAGLGGITLAFTFAPRVALAQQPARLPGSLDNNRLLDAWIRIDTNGNATVCTGKVELGQGILTALAQIAAEDFGRHREDAERRRDCRQPVDREQRHGAAACRRASSRNPS